MMKTTQITKRHLMQLKLENPQETMSKNLHVTLKITARIFRITIIYKIPGTSIALKLLGDPSSAAHQNKRCKQFIIDKQFQL